MKSCPNPDWTFFLSRYVVPVRRCFRFWWIPVLPFFSGCGNDIVDGEWIFPEHWYVFEDIRDTVRSMGQSEHFVWIAAQDGGLIRVDKHLGKSKRFNTSNSDIPTNFLTVLLVHSDSSVYIGTERFGLLYFNGRFFSQLNDVNAVLPDPAIRGLASDSSGNLWVGTLKGLVKVGTGTTELFDTSNSELTDQHIRCLSVAPDGALWIGTHRSGLYRKSENSWSHFDTSNSPLTDQLIRTIQWQNGKMWTASFGRFYTLFEGNWEVFDTENTGISSNFVNQMAFSSDGKGYFATHDGFSMKDESNWYAFHEQLPHPICEQVLIEDEHRIWIGTFGGLAIYSEEGEYRWW